MEMSEKKKTPLSDLMDASLAKIREMVNSVSRSPRPTA